MLLLSRSDGEGGAWVAKDAVNGHAELVITGGEFEGGVTTKGPDRHEFRQGGHDKLGVDFGHLDGVW